MAEADGELEVVPGCPHGRGHPDAVEQDLEGFLDDQLIGVPVGLGGALPPLHQHSLGPAPGHARDRTCAARGTDDHIACAGAHTPGRP